MCFRRNKKMAPGNPRVVVTTHKADGTSIISSDKTLEPFKPFGPQGSSFVVLDARAEVPVSNQEPSQELPNTLPRCAPGGVMFGITDFPPGAEAPMHRTLSLDYGIVMSGEIVLTVDGGEERTLRAGEYLIQGGVNHKWSNRTNEVCRIVFVMVGADKVKLESGVELEETVFKK